MFVDLISGQLLHRTEFLFSETPFLLTYKQFKTELNKREYKKEEILVVNSSRMENCDFSWPVFIYKGILPLAELMTTFFRESAELVAGSAPLFSAFMRLKNHIPYYTHE